MALDKLLEDLRSLVQGHRNSTNYYQRKNRKKREQIGLTGERLLWTRKIRKRKDRRKTTKQKDQRERQERDERKRRLEQGR